MYVVEFNKRFYNVPTDWNELTGRQLVRCMSIIHGHLQPLQKQLKMLQVLTGMSMLRFFFCPIDEIKDKLYLTLFLLTTNTLTKNIIPAYDGLFGPADNFNSLTGAEFAHTEHFFQQCMSDDSHAKLNDLVGTLYRHPKRDYDHRVNPAGDHREPFNDNIIDHYAHSVAHWPMAVKQSIHTWYGGCRMQLMRDFPRLFGGADSGSQSLHGLWSVMRNIAEKGNHGTMKDVEKMRMKEMMMELTELTAESDRLEEISRKQNQTGHHE